MSTKDTSVEDGMEIIIQEFERDLAETKEISIRCNVTAARFIIDYLRYLEIQVKKLRNRDKSMMKGLKSIAQFRGNMHDCRECYGSSGDALAQEAKETIKEALSLPSTPSSNSK